MDDTIINVFISFNILKNKYIMAMLCGIIVYSDFNKGYHTSIIIDVPMRVPLKIGFYHLFLLYMLVA